MSIPEWLLVVFAAAFLYGVARAFRFHWRYRGWVRGKMRMTGTPGIILPEQTRVVASGKDAVTRYRAVVGPAGFVDVEVYIRR